MENIQTHVHCCVDYASTCFEATGQAIWLKIFIPGLKVFDNISKPTVLYCYSEPIVFYTSNNKSSDAAKHINIKFHVVKDRIQYQTINVKHIRTTHMLADV